MTHEQTKKLTDEKKREICVYICCFFLVKLKLNTWENLPLFEESDREREREKGIRVKAKGMKGWCLLLGRGERKREGLGLRKVRSLT